MTIYERIKYLANQKNISIRELENRLGFSNGLLRSWKSSTNSASLEKVANYFGVTTDYLLGRRAQDDSKIDLTGISQIDSEEKIFSYEGKEIPKKDLELIRRILETGDYDE